MICLFYGEDQTTCIGYLSLDAVTALFVAFVVFWGFYGLFKIVLRLLGF